jgi:ubiquinone/menaquinone biosynthesis C-methylase UbiE
LTDTALRKEWADDARHRFENRYERQPSWEVGRPQPAFIDLHQRGLIGNRVLDAGCGTGETALYLALQGLDVWGLDISSTAIGMAREKARSRGVPAARFLVGDALAPDELGMVFDSVTDSGLLHALTDAQRDMYVAGVRRALVDGGTFHVLCFSEHEMNPRTEGPRCVKRADLEAAFAKGWEVLAIDETRFHTNIHPGGAEAYIASARRV